ncbi:DUF223 domain protein [Medicago truncatula]|uniref:DUF223 domain protein n=1 Tax=Medicago truncatula TaxID=3880 RepID=G7KDB8_MEDTR|nr:DUF223 domain protein [Medicago truncatula]
MSTKHNFISNVSPRKQSWTLVVKVVRAWFGQDYKNKKLPFSMEVIKFGASIRRTLIYKFKNQLQEGMMFTISSFNVASNSDLYRPSHKEYKLNFTINTKVKLSITVLVPTNVYSFTPAPDVFNEFYDNNYLVDVIGVMIGVGVEREYCYTLFLDLKILGPNFISNFVNYQISTARFKLSLLRSIFNHNFTYVFLA